MLSNKFIKMKIISSIYKYILEKGFIDIHPDMRIALLMLLGTQLEQNCSAERYFSALKIVMNNLKSTLMKAGFLIV